MACDATTLVANAASKGFQALSSRDLKLCTLYAICAGSGAVSGLTAAQILALAMAQKYAALSDRDLDEAILAALCP